VLFLPLVSKYSPQHFVPNTLTEIEGKYLIIISTACLCVLETKHRVGLIASRCFSMVYFYVPFKPLFNHAFVSFPHTYFVKIKLHSANISEVFSVHDLRAQHQKQERTVPAVSAVYKNLVGKLERRR
jgi:hypothetical protein